MIRFVLDFYRSRFSLNSVPLSFQNTDFASSVLQCYHLVWTDNLKLETLSYIAVYLVYSVSFVFMG